MNVPGFGVHIRFEPIFVVPQLTYIVGWYHVLVPGVIRSDLDSEDFRRILDQNSKHNKV